MVDVTARLARPIGQESFADLTTVKPSVPVANADGTVTISFPDVTLSDERTNEETLALVVERMTTADEAEVTQRRAIRAALVGLLSQGPMPPIPADVDVLTAWLLERAELQDAFLQPLAALFGAAPE